LATGKVAENNTAATDNPAITLAHFVISLTPFDLNEHPVPQLDGPAHPARTFLFASSFLVNEVTQSKYDTAFEADGLNDIEPVSGCEATHGRNRGDAKLGPSAMPMAVSRSLVFPALIRRRDGANYTLIDFPRSSVCDRPALIERINLSRQ
jgi:hypothetical protein